MKDATAQAAHGASEAPLSGGLSVSPARVVRREAEPSTPTTDEGMTSGLGLT